MPDSSAYDLKPNLIPNPNLNPNANPFNPANRNLLILTLFERLAKNLFLLFISKKYLR